MRLNSEISYLNEISQISNEDNNETLMQMRNELINLIITQYNVIFNDITLNYYNMR